MSICPIGGKPCIEETTMDGEHCAWSGDDGGCAVGALLENAAWFFGNVALHKDAPLMVTMAGGELSVYD